MNTPDNIGTYRTLLLEALDLNSDVQATVEWNRKVINAYARGKITNIMKEALYANLQNSQNLKKPQSND